MLTPIRILKFDEFLNFALGKPTSCSMLFTNFRTKFVFALKRFVPMVSESKNKNCEQNEMTCSKKGNMNPRTEKDRWDIDEGISFSATFCVVGATFSIICLWLQLF